VPRFEIHIMEMNVSVDLPVGPNEPTPEVRDVFTTAEAPDSDAAVEVAWRAWDAKYGPNQRPEAPRIDIKAL
jgi:hypothetical protein